MVMKDSSVKALLLGTTSLYPNFEHIDEEYYTQKMSKFVVALGGGN